MALFSLLAQTAQVSASPSPDQGLESDAGYVFVKLAITIAVLLVLAARWTHPKLKIDGVTLGLLLLAAVPLVGEFIQSIETAGGNKLVFRDIWGKLGSGLVEVRPEFIEKPAG